MHSSRFDLAIAGDSLAARMAAAILVKHGKRLLLLSAPVCHDSWYQSSLFVDKVLAILGGQDCRIPSQPFQVLSSRARVTITPGLPLSGELTREFGETAPLVADLLADLERLGTALESLFDEHGGLPVGGFAATARWRWLCLRRKLPLARLEAPLAGRLGAVPEPAAAWLRDLFQGLALQPLEALTVADGALLWAQACRPQGVDGDHLRQFLSKRFEQFHGVETALTDLHALEHSGGHWVGSLRGGGRFQATQLILGDLGHGLPGQAAAFPRQLMTPSRHFVTSALDGQLSPLLTRRVIPGGPLPMRLAINATARGLSGQIGTLPHAGEPLVRRQLDPFLPFARYELAEPEHCRCNSPANAAPAATLPLFRLPFHAGRHLWCADDTRLLPQLGTGGAALLAWTLARQLDPACV